MSADIHLAFDHPEARAAATMPEGAPLDRISLRDFVVDVEIGAFQAERGTTQKIGFNIVVEVEPLNAPVNDDVDRILSYERITWAIEHELAAERLNLLETSAQRVADRILLEPQAHRVFVRIEKLDRGPGALGVEIVRSQTEPTLQPIEEVEQETAPHPIVVYLSNDAIKMEGLIAAIDQLQSTGDPLIFCVGLPDEETTQSTAMAAQRRIDLLAIEQNAWVLAGRDKRCVVVGTWTEIDWAMKNGQITVWAPSKIVLDSVETPQAAPDDALGLAIWFASQVAAKEFVTIGARAPDVLDLASREIEMDLGA